MAKEIVNLFGSEIGVCVSEPQLLSQMKKLGKGDALLHIAEVVAQKVLTSTGIRTYVENQLGLQKSPPQFSFLLDMSHHSDVLKKNFGLPDVGAEDDLIYYKIYESMRDTTWKYRSIQPPDGTWERIIYDVKEEVAKWTAAPAYAVLAERMKNSAGLAYLDLSDMLYALSDLDKINPDYGKKVFIETTLINALNLRK